MAVEQASFATIVQRKTGVRSVCRRCFSIRDKVSAVLSELRAAFQDPTAATAATIAATRARAAIVSVVVMRQDAIRTPSTQTGRAWDC